MIVRHLNPSDADAFQALRLYALKESPTAFASSHDEEAEVSNDVLQSRLTANPDRAVLGAFVSGQLSAMVGLRRETARKASHKAVLWGLYVSPSYRGHGLGRSVLAELLAQARSMPGVMQLNLTVNSTNSAAITLYESVGFEVYGHERRALIVAGVPFDELYMSLHLRED